MSLDDYLKNNLVNSVIGVHVSHQSLVEMFNLPFLLGNEDNTNCEQLNTTTASGTGTAS